MHHSIRQISNSKAYTSNSLKTNLPDNFKNANNKSIAEAAKLTKSYHKTNKSNNLNKKYNKPTSIRKELNK